MKKANALLKTEPEMKHDYSVAQYPYSKETYDYFVRMSKSIEPQDNTKALSGKRDKNGIYIPADEIKELGKELRNLFNQNKGR